MQRGKITTLWTTTALFLTLLLFQFCKKDPEVSLQPLVDEKEQFSGGDFTTFDVSAHAYGNSGLTLSSEGQDKFVIGNSFFRNNWVAAPSSTVARDGVGPLLNSLSCSGCHADDGRGRPPLIHGEKLSSMLIRLSTPGKDAYGGPVGLVEYGDQLNTKGISGVLSEGDVLIEYIEQLGSYKDGASYSLRNPIYTFKDLGYGSLPSDVLFSPRVAPQMPGLGLLEAIDEKDILILSDPEDLDRDGISGRPNRVWDFSKSKIVLGRFGWKANQPGIEQQTAGAFLGDMGITSPMFQNESLGAIQHSMYDILPNGGSPEIEEKIINNVVFYSSTLAVPARRNFKDSEVIRGKSLFTNIGCGKCHNPSFTTGNHPFIPELSNQKIMPYTDLLLHDMGPALADGRPDYEAQGNEWRTPPLWGLGLLKTVSNHTFLLHDGRARNFEEAILWHGGEGEISKKEFTNLDLTQRTALIKFLESL